MRLKFNKIIIIISIIISYNCDIDKNVVFNKSINSQNSDSTYIMTFGSCSDPTVEKQLWVEILKENPDCFVFTGDVVYPIGKHSYIGEKEAFEMQAANLSYQKLKNNIEIHGTWDDHDYGLRDGGEENVIKDSVKELILKFLEVPNNDIRWQRNDGIYYSTYLFNKRIKLIMLDSRYNRTSLIKSESSPKLYDPNNSPSASILGKQQKKWLYEEINNSDAQLNIVVSSIQFLNNSHQFEKWGNFTQEYNEIRKLFKKQNNVLIISGDRHFSEISVDEGLVDITCSGLTEVYTYEKEENPLRITDFYKTQNFGYIKFKVLNDGQLSIEKIKFISHKNEVLMEMNGDAIPTEYLLKKNNKHNKQIINNR